MLVLRETKDGVSLRVLHVGRTDWYNTEEESGKGRTILGRLLWGPLARVLPHGERGEGGAILGEDAGRLKVRVSAGEEHWQANQEIRRFLAKVLGVPDAQVTMLEGARIPEKWLVVKGLSGRDVAQRLARFKVYSEVILVQ